jgi:hypothetical protein
MTISRPSRARLWPLLNTYSTADKPIDILGIAEAAGEFDDLYLLLQRNSDTPLGKKQVNLGFMFNTLPVFFLDMEAVEFEEGMWHGAFPPLNGLTKTIMNKAVPRHSGRWQFVSCDADKVKNLAV